MTKCPKCGQLIPSSTAKCPACGNPTGKKINTGLTVGVILLMLALIALTILLGYGVWSVIVFVLGILYFIRLRKIRNREEASAAAASDMPEKECRLCGIKAEELVPAVLPSGKTIYVCGECFRANKFHKPGEEKDSVGGKPAEETAADVKPEEIPTAEPARKAAPLLTETEAEREARIACLTEKRKSGGFLQEELFLEDIEDENSIKKILELWDSYDLSGDYPGIGARLGQLAEKDYLLPFSAAKQLREELHDLFA